MVYFDFCFIILITTLKVPQLLLPAQNSGFGFLFSKSKFQYSDGLTSVFEASSDSSRTVKGRY